MKVKICDICGKPILFPEIEHHWKVKRLDSSLGVWVKMDFHDECINKVMTAEMFNQLWEEAECDSDSTTD